MVRNIITEDKVLAFASPSKIICLSSKKIEEIEDVALLSSLQSFSTGDEANTSSRSGGMF